MSSEFWTVYAKAWGVEGGEYFSEFLKDEFKNGKTGTKLKKQLTEGKIIQTGRSGGWQKGVGREGMGGMKGRLPQDFRFIML